MADYLPKFSPGAVVTYGVTAAVLGGQLVLISGNGTVAPTASGANTVEGVAMRDAAVGQQAPVLAGGVQVLTTAAAMVAGQRVMPGNGGTVQPWGPVSPAPTAAPEHICGQLLESAPSGGTARVRLRR